MYSPDCTTTTALDPNCSITQINTHAHSVNVNEGYNKFYRYTIKYPKQFINLSSYRHRTQQQYCDNTISNKILSFW